MWPSDSTSSIDVSRRTSPHACAVPSPHRPMPLLVRRWVSSVPSISLRTLFTSHCPRLTSHCSRLIAYSSRLTAHIPLLASHRTLHTSYCSLLTAHMPLHTACGVSCRQPRSEFFTVHQVETRLVVSYLGSTCTQPVVSMYRHGPVREAGIHPSAIRRLCSPLRCAAASQSCDAVTRGSAVCVSTQQASHGSLGTLLVSPQSSVHSRRVSARTPVGFATIDSDRRSCSPVSGWSRCPAAALPSALAEW